MRVTRVYECDKHIIANIDMGTNSVLASFDSSAKNLLIAACIYRDLFVHDCKFEIEFIANTMVRTFIINAYGCQYCLRVMYMKSTV